MNIPGDLHYTKDHEWVRIVDDIATIGVTDYAQNQLGDIIFIESTHDYNTWNKFKEIMTVLGQIATILVVVTR